MSYGEDLLERYIKLMIPHSYERNARPSWCNGLELDFLFPSIYAAIEFQGDQHYKPTAFKSSDTSSAISAALDQTQLHDKLKRRTCIECGVTLVRLAAVDLNYQRIRHRLSEVKGWVSKKMYRENDALLKLLNKEAISYRKILISKFDSASARLNRWRSRSSAIRRAKALHGYIERYAKPRSQSGSSSGSGRTR